MRILFSVIALLLPLANSLKFLAYSPQFGASHVNFMGKISDVLVDAGHEVVMISPRTDTLIGSTGTKKARVIEIPQTPEAMKFEQFINNKMVKNVWKESSMMKMMDGVEVIMEANIAQCNATLHHPGLVELLKEEKFDVGFTESHDFCSLGLFHLAGIDKFAITESLALVDGDFFFSQVPSNPAYVPSFTSGFTGDKMTFLERASNFMITFMTGIAKQSMLEQWQPVFTGYHKDFPKLKDLVTQNSLVFLNSDPLVDFPRPSAARIIDIGGITVASGPKKLNETWSSLLSLRPHTVLISFGSFAKAHLMLEEYKQSIVTTARQFPEKPENRISEGVDNLIETTWMPQNDILHDPRLSAFVTHGGQGSVTEANYAGVPLVVIPICFDQLRNAAQVKRNGVGLVVEKTDLVNEKKLEEAIREILTNDKYRIQAKKVQQMLKERPFSMRDIFVRNMEFLAKHGPLRQLDHYGRHLNVFQYYLIDVVACVAGTALVVFLIAVLLIRACLRRMFTKLVEKPKREKDEPAKTFSFPTPVTYTDVLFGEWELEKTIHFMEYTHLPVSIAATLGYLIMVNVGPHVMRKSKAFDLRGALALWNMTLCIYSAVSLYFFYPYVLQSYNKGGLIGTLCYNDDLYTNKGPELVDTVFLILRKRPVIFMHWYHHSVTFLLGQLCFTEFVPWARWGILLNLMVHTVMYFYYGLRAWGIKTGRWVSQLITCMQITQFALGLYFVGRVGHVYITKELPDCEAKAEKMALGSIVVATYLYLFCQYFYKTYIKNDSPTRPKIPEAVDEKEVKKDQ